MLNIDHINKKEALRYLGYGENPADKTIESLLEHCEKVLLETANPKYIFRNFKISLINETVILDGCNITFSGKDIFEHLKNCERAVLFCATLSDSVDRLIRLTQIKSMAEAVVLDSLANVLIEQSCDMIQDIIAEELNEFNQTWRFSPGYGDLPLDIEKIFLQVLDAPKKIGLCTNEANILIPKKSVTGIIGLSKNMISREKRGCQTCNLKNNCAFIRKGVHCEF